MLSWLQLLQCWLTVRTVNCLSVSFKSCSLDKDYWLMKLFTLDQLTDPKPFLGTVLVQVLFGLRGSEFGVSLHHTTPIYHTPNTVLYYCTNTILL